MVQKLSINDKAILGDDIDHTNDAAYDYATVFCHFASLALEFKNSWEEGDGNRTIRCWKLLLLHFRSSNCTKYAWEALRLQFQLIQLPPTLSHQLKWERYVNVHGSPGSNIPCDLFNEHMNKLFKDIITHMGANLTAKTVQRAARSVTTITKIRSVFDEQTGIPVQTSAHAERNDDDEVSTVAEVLIKNQILEIVPKRKLSQFKSFNQNPLAGLDRDKMETWIERKKKEIITYNLAVGEGCLSLSDATDVQDSTASDNSC